MTGTAHEDSLERWLGRVIFALEATVLSLLLLLVLVLGLAQAVARQIDILDLAWTGPAMQAVVLWLVMSGGVVAAGRLRHFRLTTLEGWLPGRLRMALRRGAFLLAGLVCLALTWHGLKFAALEYEFRQIAFLNVPNWMVLMIVPVAFGIMGARFAAWAIIPPPVSAVPIIAAGRWR